MKYELSEEGNEKRLQIKITLFDRVILVIFVGIFILFGLTFVILGFIHEQFLSVLFGGIIAGIFILILIHDIRKNRYPSIYVNPSEKIMRVEDLFLRANPEDKVVLLRTFTWRRQKSRTVYGQKLEIPDPIINIDYEMLGQQHVHWGVLYERAEGASFALLKVTISGNRMNDIMIPRFAEDLAEFLGVGFVDKTGAHEVFKKPGETDMFIGEKLKRDGVSFDVFGVIQRKPDVFTIDRMGESTTLKVKLDSFTAGDVFPFFVMFLSYLFAFLIGLFDFLMIKLFLGAISKKDYGGAGLAVFWVLILSGFVLLLLWFGLYMVNKTRILAEFGITPDMLNVKVKGLLYPVLKRTVPLKRIENVNIINYWYGTTLEIVTDDERFIIYGGLKRELAEEFRNVLLGLFVEVA